MLKPNSAVTVNLMKARELIADEKNWCQRAFYRGEQRCVLGAIGRIVGFEEDYWEAASLLHKAGRELFKLSAPGVNDHLGYAASIQMMDRAIELSLQD